MVMLNSSPPWWKSKLLWLIVPLVLILGAWFVNRYYVLKDTTEISPPSYEARTNEYLALERLLQRNHINTQVKKGALNPSELPAQNSVLFVVDGADELKVVQRNRLKSWVAQGGHLVLLVPSWDAIEPNGTSNADTLWYQFGVDLVAHEEPLFVGHELVWRDVLNSSEQTLNWNPHANRLETQWLSALKELAQSNEPKHYGVNTGFRWNPNLQAKSSAKLRATWQARVVKDNPERAQTEEDKSEYAGMQVNFGRGVVTLMQDVQWLTNEGLDAEDNAYMAWRVFASDTPQRARPTQVWIYPNVQGASAPNVWDMLRTRVPWLVWTCVVLGVLLLWWYRTISGPRLSAMTHTRQNLWEHLRAVGWYLYRADKGQYWLRQSQTQLNLPVTDSETSQQQFIEHTRVIQQHARQKWYQRFRMKE